MSLLPPKYGNPLLPWGRLPPRLRFLRVFFFAVSGICIGDMSALFGLQYRVLASPRFATDGYTHPVAYKGATFYLADPLFSAWTAMYFAVMPLWIAAVLLMLANNGQEYRLKRQPWDKGLGDLLEREGGPRAGTD